MSVKLGIAAFCIGAVLAVICESARAADISSSLPETGAKPTANGADFKITNGANGSASATPTAILGVALGKNGRGIAGMASGAGGVAVDGTNSATGAAGRFELTGNKAGPSDSAVIGVNSASGPASNESQFGAAGLFEITNANNQGTALVARGTAGDGLDVSTKSGIALDAEGGGLRDLRRERSEWQHRRLRIWRKLWTVRTCRVRHRRLR